MTTMNPTRSPERIWLKEEANKKITWRSSSDGSSNEVEYVRADLLTTARKEAFKDAGNVAANEMITAEVELNESDAAYNKAIADVVAALEAAATTEKGGKRS